MAIAWHDKKESVSLVWEISLRNVVIGKYVPSYFRKRRPSRKRRAEVRTRNILPVWRQRAVRVVPVSVTRYVVIVPNR